MQYIQQQANRPIAPEYLRWFYAANFFALFAGALFDQVALPSVAAGVEAGGRVRYEPYRRALRSAASDQIVEWGDPVDSELETDRLRDLHREVKGLGYNGVRYSALTPESWNWIMISTFFMYHNAYTPITGRTPTADDSQYLWEEFKRKTTGLHLGGCNGLPDTYMELREYYESMVQNRVEANKTLDNAVTSLSRPPRPPFVPAIAAPLWLPVALIAGRIVTTYSFGIMHPTIRELAHVRWTNSRRAEFVVLCKVLQIAYRILPKRVTYLPLAYNRWKYEQLITKYRSVGLESFTPRNAARPMTSTGDLAQNCPA